MRGDNSINTSSLAGKKRSRKASEVGKNGQILEPKMFGLPLYLCNAVPSTPIKRGLNDPAYEMRKERQKKKKKKKKGRERERQKGGKNAGSNRKKTKTKKNKTKKTSPCA